MDNNQKSEIWYNVALPLVVEIGHEIRYKTVTTQFRLINLTGSIAPIG